MPLETLESQCPYCGETIEVDVEPMEESQSFIQDCAVCCHPIQFNVTSTDEGVELHAARAN